MSLPRIVLTGASGFIGRHLLDSLKDNFQVIALARRSQIRCGAPYHENITWHQVDIGFQEALAEVFTQIKGEGGADLVLHLAAHYDFTGEDDPEYHRTNVQGLRNILDNCRQLKPRRFIFSSSVAACGFPPAGQALNEDSPPDGDHIYAQTKAIGEAMLAEYKDDFPSVIVRFAALFSDWCEYPPLYIFIRTWLSRAWNNRMLGGKGESAIPYLHLKDGVSFLTNLLDKVMDQPSVLDDGEVVIASPDGSVSHDDLYSVTTGYENEGAKPPIRTPKIMALPGIYIMGFMGRLLREETFEKPWMAKYIDLKLTIDSSRTRERLNWQPRKRLDIMHRMPFILENRKYDRVYWTKCNRDAMKQVRVRPNLKIHSLLEKHKEEIASAFTVALKEKFPSYNTITDQEHDWNHRQIMRALRNAIRLRVKADFMSYCRDLAELRLRQGFDGTELLGALETLNEVCLEVVHADPEAEDMRLYTPTCITMTILFGIDQVKDMIDETQQRESTFVEKSNRNSESHPPVGPSATGPGCPI